MMKNVLAYFAVQKYPASMQSCDCHSPRHGCVMKTWSSFVFLYKAYEVSSTLEFSLLVGSNSPKLFSFLAHLFPPLLLREWELMGSVLQDTDPSGTSSTNHLCKGLNFNCPEAAEVNGTVPGTAGGSSSLTLQPDLLTSLWLPRCHSLGVTSAHVCLSWN